MCSGGGEKRRDFDDKLTKPPLSWVKLWNENDSFVCYQKTWINMTRQLFFASVNWESHRNCLLKWVTDEVFEVENSSNLIWSYNFVIQRCFLDCESMVFPWKLGKICFKPVLYEILSIKTSPNSQQLLCVSLSSIALLPNLWRLKQSHHLIDSSPNPSFTLLPQIMSWTTLSGLQNINWLQSKLFLLSTIYNKFAIKLKQ